MSINIKDILERLSGLRGRALEDELYQIVWNEIEAGQMDPVSQARALADSGGDEAKVKSAYISHRVRRLRDQLAMMQQEVDRQASRSKPSKKQRGFTEAEMEQARRKQFTYPYSASGGGAAEVPLPRKRPYRLEDSPKGFELADNILIVMALLVGGVGLLAFLIVINS